MATTKDYSGRDVFDIPLARHMISEKLMPSACEVDVAVTLARYGSQRASRRSSALMNASHCAGILAESIETDLGWDVDRHASHQTPQR